ncbi:MAG: phosphoribosylaminoimidazolesuccinocarboxamide synthase [Chitinophagales bacterium]
MNYLYEFDIPELEKIHRGKVRDSFRVDDQRRLIVVSDRISAFDSNLKNPIPSKGAVLNGIANWWFENTRHITDNHVIKMIDPNAMLVKEAVPIRVEMVVRGYICGSVWRGYEQGERTFSGAKVPDNLTRNAAFPQPILTPTTKEKNDRPITPDEIVAEGWTTAELYEQMSEKALALFDFGSKVMADRGYILVDTKYEFGLLDGELILIDEIHTPDSSRFWSAEDYAKAPAKAAQIDKEFVRQWMLANPTSDGKLPSTLSDEVVAEAIRRYRHIYETLTGQALKVDDKVDALEQLRGKLKEEGII